MTLIDALNKLSQDGLKVNVAFDVKTIQQFMLWGALAAIVAATISAIVATFLAKKING